MKKTIELKRWNNVLRHDINEGEYRVSKKSDYFLDTIDKLRKKYKGIYEKDITYNITNVGRDEVVQVPELVPRKMDSNGKWPTKDKVTYRCDYVCYLTIYYKKKRKKKKKNNPQIIKCPNCNTLLQED